MRQLQPFLNTQHHLKEPAKDNYRKAINAFEREAKAEFEDVYLDSEKVHAVLNLLHQRMSDSGWNLYLVLFKRYAKWLSDPDDEVTPKLYRKIGLIKIDWGKKHKDKWLTEEEFKAILEVIDYQRDKAMFGVAVEGALRSGELLGLKIGDCKKPVMALMLRFQGRQARILFLLFCLLRCLGNG